MTLIDNTPISCKVIGDLFGIDGKRLQVQYYRHLSNFTTWDQRDHAEQWLVFADNIGPCLSMDEVSLSQGELYTIITNKEAGGRKGALVAIIQGTVSRTAKSGAKCTTLLMVFFGQIYWLLMVKH